MSTVEWDVTDGVDVDGDAQVADAALLLQALGRETGELSLLYTDDETIRPLNRDYRGNDSATDVLSFSQLEGDPIGDPNLLGDVVISVPTAARQGAERGHGTAHELRVLLIHGVCHLVGYDHEDDDDAEVMEARERDLLAALATARPLR